MHISIHKIIVYLEVGVLTLLQELKLGKNHQVGISICAEKLENSGPTDGPLGHVTWRGKNE